MILRLAFGSLLARALTVGMTILAIALGVETKAWVWCNHLQWKVFRRFGFVPFPGCSIFNNWRTVFIIGIE